MLAGLLIVAMLVGGLATLLALAASMPVGVAILLYPVAGSSFLMAVIAVRLSLGAIEGRAVAVPVRSSGSR